MVQEHDIRNADFSLHETRVQDGGEVDVFKSPELEGVEIQVLLERKTLQGAGQQMLYRGIRFTDDHGQALRIVDERGHPLDQQSAEVVAWAIVEEDLDRSLEYAYGRAPSSEESGSVIIHQESGAPSPAL